MEIKKGYLITFEGAEGSGKNTQAAFCSQYLSQLKISNQIVKELRDTEAGRRIKSLLTNNKSTLHLDQISRIALFAAARRELFTKIIQPRLEEGKTIIVPGYALSTLAYQGFGDLDGQWTSLDGIVKENELVTEGTFPDITFILGTTCVIAHEHSNKGNKYCFNVNRDLEYYSKVVEGYERIATRYNRKGVILISQGSIKEIHEKQIHLFEDILFSEDAKKEILLAEEKNNRQEVIHKRIFEYSKKISKKYISDISL